MSQNDSDQVSKCPASIVSHYDASPIRVDCSAELDDGSANGLKTKS